MAWNKWAWVDFKPAGLHDLSMEAPIKIKKIMMMGLQQNKCEEAQEVDLTKCLEAEVMEVALEASKALLEVVEALGVEAGEALEAEDLETPGVEAVEALEAEDLETLEVLVEAEVALEVKTKVLEAVVALEVEAVVVMEAAEATMEAIK